MRAVGTRCYMACQIPSFGRFGARRAQRRIENALRVVAAEPKDLDRLERGGTAWAAEATPGRRGLAAMHAGRLAGRGRRRGTDRKCRAKRGRGHRTMIRRVAAIA